MFDPLSWSCLELLWNVEQLYFELLPLYLGSYRIGLACIFRTVVVTVTNFLLSLVRFIIHITISGFKLGMIASTSYHDLPDLISISIHPNPHIRMLKYNSNCTSHPNRHDLTKTLCPVLEPDPSNGFDSIGAILATTLEAEPLEAYFWEQSDVPSPWNLYGTKAAAYRGGLELDDPTFGDSWTKY